MLRKWRRLRISRFILFAWVFVAVALVPLAVYLEGRGRRAAVVRDLRAKGAAISYAHFRRPKSYAYDAKTLKPLADDENDEWYHRYFGRDAFSNVSTVSISGSNFTARDVVNLAALKEIQVLDITHVALDQEAIDAI